MFAFDAENGKLLFLFPFFERILVYSFFGNLSMWTSFVLTFLRSNIVT